MSSRRTRTHSRSRLERPRRWKFSIRDRATTSEAPHTQPAWRLIVGPGNDGARATTGARNMAVDHTLLESVQQGAAPVLRLYYWDPPTLSLGRNQRAVGIYDPERAVEAGIDIVRRPTGGLAVLHHQELTYCVVAPVVAVGSPRLAYARINDALVNALADLHVHATLAAGEPTRNPVTASAQPCFQSPAGGEVVAGGKKLVGSAQRCERGVVLQHGSILMDGTQATVTELLLAREPAAQPAGSITLRELLGAAPAGAELEEAVRVGFERVFGTRFAPASLTREETARALQLESHYGSAAWTWRC